MRIETVVFAPELEARTRAGWVVVETVKATRAPVATWTQTPQQTQQAETRVFEAETAYRIAREEDDWTPFETMRIERDNANAHATTAIREAAAEREAAKRAVESCKRDAESMARIATYVSGIERDVSELNRALPRFRTLVDDVVRRNKDAIEAIEEKRT